MTKKILNFWMLAVSLSLLAFTACSSDDDDLVLEKGEIEVSVGDAQTVKIVEGNGGYNVSSASAAVATAKIENNAVVISGVSVGETTITVKDKEDKTATIKVKVTAKDNAQAVAGTYSGNISVSIGGGDPSQPIESDIKITRTDVDEIKMTLENFSFLEQPVGTIEVKDIPLEVKNGVITLKETTETVILTGLENLSAEVTVTGTIEGNKLKMNIAVVAGEGQETLNITVIFDGDKK